MRAGLLDGAQQRSLDQERFGEQLSRGGGAIEIRGRLEQPNLEQLPGVVPLVDRLADVEPLVALQPDERRGQRGRDHLGHFGLAHTRLPFEEERTPQLRGQVD